MSDEKKKDAQKMYDGLKDRMKEVFDDNDEMREKFGKDFCNDDDLDVFNLIKKTYKDTDTTFLFLRERCKDVDQHKGVSAVAMQMGGDKMTFYRIFRGIISSKDNPLGKLLIRAVLDEISENKERFDEITGEYMRDKVFETLIDKLKGDLLEHLKK